MDPQNWPPFFGKVHFTLHSITSILHKFHLKYINFLIEGQLFKITMFPNKTFVTIFVIIGAIVLFEFPKRTQSTFPMNLDHRGGNLSKDDTENNIKRELKKMLAKPNESIQLVKNPEEKYDIIAFENAIIDQLLQKHIDAATKVTKFQLKMLLKEEIYIAFVERILAKTNIVEKTVKETIEMKKKNKNVEAGNVKKNIEDTVLNYIIEEMKKLKEVGKLDKKTKKHVRKMLEKEIEKPVYRDEIETLNNLAENRKQTKKPKKKAAAVEQAKDQDDNDEAPIFPKMLRI